VILKLGSSGPEVGRFFDYFTKWASGYAFLLGRRDLYYGKDEAAFTRELQRRLGVPITGAFGDAEAARTGYRWTGTTTPPAVQQVRPIWAYSAPGSGAPGDVGPPFQLGERCKRELNIHHQWVGYPIGGYLGVMGGDPRYSYNDIIGFEDRELERLLWLNPDVVQAIAARRLNRNAAVAVELWFFAYSQSADGMRRAILRLFGDGGPFEVLRDRINGLVLFGDPGTPKTGISGLSYPLWLELLCSEINYPNDFYAVAPDKIRRAMFGIIVEAQMELPFFVHVLRLAVRIIPDWLTLGAPVVGPLLGGLGGLLGSPAGGGAFGGLAQLAIGSATGLTGNPLFGQMMGLAGGPGDQKVDNDLYNLLTPTGVLSSIPDMIGLVAALPGLQAHGGYEFDPAMMDRAFQVIAGFRR
jgi:hypothetical protein